MAEKMYYDTCLISKFISSRRLDVIEMYIETWKMKEPTLVPAIVNELSTYHTQGSVSWDNLKNVFTKDPDPSPEMLLKIRYLAKDMTRDDAIRKNLSRQQIREKLNRSANLGEAAIIVHALSDIKNGTISTAWMASDDILASIVASRKHIRVVTCKRMMRNLGFSENEISIAESKCDSGWVDDTALLREAKAYNKRNPNNP